MIRLNQRKRAFPILSPWMLTICGITEISGKYQQNLKNHHKIKLNNWIANIYIFLNLHRTTIKPPQNHHRTTTKDQIRSQKYCDYVKV